jgi:hypothetical protein
MAINSLEGGNVCVAGSCRESADEGTQTCGGPGT